MTSASVGDVKAFVTAPSSGKVTGAGNAGSADFRAVWEKQTSGQGVSDAGHKVREQKTLDAVAQRADNAGKNTAPEKGTASKKGAVTEQPEDSKAVGVVSNRSEDTQAEGVEKGTTAEGAADDGMTAEGMTEEEIAAAMEVLGTVVVEFVHQIAQELGITEEELNSILNDLGMKQSDLLQPENLTQFILAAGGEENMVSLVTNEELYQDFRSLMGQLEDTLARFNEQTGLQPEKLQEMSDQIAKMPRNIEGAVFQSPEEPVPAVVMEDESLVVNDEEQRDEPERISGEDMMEEVHSMEESVPSRYDMDAAKAGNNGQEQKEASSGRGESGNPFTPNLLGDMKAEAMQAEMNQAVMAEDTSTESIMRQIMDYMKIQMKPDMTNLELQLHPESLGTLQINLASKGGVVTAQFIAENEAVKNALESQMIRLAENFQEQGIKVEAVEVTVQTHEFERNMNQNQDQAQEESNRKGRTRSINLNFPADLEEMSEEEQLAAQIMAANGNTVDYTA